MWENLCIFSLLHVQQSQCKYIVHHAVKRGVGGAKVEGSAAEGAHCAQITHKRGK